MITRTGLVAVLALATVIRPSIGQERAKGTASKPRPPMVVRTFSLERLNPESAAKLVAPYVLHPDGGVFDGGGNAGAITVRETQDVVDRIAAVLRERDLPRPTVTLRFQLIAATETPQHDSSIADIDRALRSLLRNPGYRVIGEGVAAVAERGQFAVTMAGDAGRYVAIGQLWDLLDGFATVGMTIALRAAAVSGAADSGSVVDQLARVKSNGEAILSTSVNVRIGEATVLGSGSAATGRTALILVVRPTVR